MPESQHGHQIVQILLDSAGPMTADALRNEAARRFGAIAHYHTCGATELTFDDLLAFLLERGKITEREGKLLAHSELICGSR